MKSARTVVTPNKRERGTTLIETLVALLVLSIGLLGIAGMQMTSLQNNRGAHLRSQAQVLAYDIADRMRANRTAAITGLGYTIGFGATATGSTVMAADLNTWKQSLAITLPAGDGQIDIVPGTNMVRITVQWTDSIGTQQFVTRTRI
jgi:type IV pilus assembly protein PilV